MHKLLVSTALLAAIGASPANSALLTIDVFDGATMVATDSSTSGTANIATSDANFTSIIVGAVGSPLVPFADLSSVALNVKSASAGSHTLTIDVFQTGVSAPAGTKLQTTMTTNDLIGDPGPTTESSFFNGTNSTLGTLLATHTFPVGVTVGHFGPVVTPIGTPLTADAHQYMVTFTAPRQSSNDTIQLTTGVPEPSQWAMLLLGAGFLALAGHRARGRLALY